MSKNQSNNHSKNLGIASGSQGSSINYSDNVVMRGSRGHGFAAEKANHLYDVYTGKDAQLVGGDNVKNGADRIVDGQLIQTKYCSSGSKCISETFDRNGTFRYLDKAGNPMQIEVPADMYESAVQSMRARIERGQVPGVSDPEAAKNIVRKGRYTYEQAKNIAKAGTVEGLTYDAVNGIKLAGVAMGITSLLSYAANVWQGKRQLEALEAACFDGICVGGLAWVSSIMTAQIGKTGVENSLRTVTDWSVKQLNPKVVNALANAFRNGNNIYGAAAANHVSKILRGQIVVTVAVTALLSTDDFIDFFQSRISSKQAFKNVCHTLSGVAGGAGGMWAGAALGAKVGAFGGVPGVAVGTTVGGLIGGVTGGFSASSLTKSGLDAVIDDDSVDIGRLIELVFGQLSTDYLLTEEECNLVISDFQVLDMEKTIKEIHSASDSWDHAYNLILPFIENVVKKRTPVFLPKKRRVVAVTNKVLEKMEAA